MKPAPILAVAALLVALVAALGIAFWWQSPSNEPVDASGTSAPAPAQPAKQQGPASAVAGENGAHDRETLPTPSEAGADLPQGVRGVVVDPQGQGVPGLRVFLIENIASNNPFAIHLQMQQGVPMLPAAQTTTDARGAFALGLKKPSDKKYDVRVLAEKYADAAHGPLQVPPGDWYDLGQIHLAPGLVVRGRVTIAGTDFPAPQATVTLTSASAFEDMTRAALPGREQGLRVTADANGFYEIRNAPLAAPWTLQALAPGFAKVVRSPIDPSVEQPATTVDFELPRGLSIQGRVLAGSGRPVAEAHIQATAMQSDGSRLEAFSDAAGNFEVHGMREGNQWLRITAKGFQMHDERAVAAGTQGLQIVLEETGSARARVRDPDGRLLDRYALGVRRWFAHNGGSIGSVPGVPDLSVRPEDLVDGVVTLQGIDQGSDQEHFEYVFQVQAEGFAKTFSQPFQIGGPSGAPLVEVTVTRGAILIGMVQDERGKPVEGAEVTTQQEGSVEDGPLRMLVAALAPDKITRAKTRTDAQGQFRLERLCLCDYQLKIAHAEYCDGLVRGLQVAAPGEQRLPAIVLLRGTQVRGTVTVDGVAQGQVKVVVDSDPAAAEAGSVHAETVSSQDGTFTMPRRLPPGSYEIKAAQLGGDAANPDIFRTILQMKQTATSFELRGGQATIDHSLNIITR